MCVIQKGWKDCHTARPTHQLIMKSQHKCVVVFALVCCCALLMALIFSAVDVWGEDEDTGQSCSRTCRVVLVESIPEGLSVPYQDTVPLSVALRQLLDEAHHLVEIVSPHWTLNSSQATQGQMLLAGLKSLASRSVSLRVISGLTDSAELTTLSHYGAEVRYLNMTTLTNGYLNSSFWVVDKKHMYMGSAGMDWRSLATVEWSITLHPHDAPGRRTQQIRVPTSNQNTCHDVTDCHSEELVLMIFVCVWFQKKEFGMVVYNCSCLVMDLHRIFILYWQLQYKEFVPSTWSKKLSALYNRGKNLDLHLNDTEAHAYISSSPDAFCPKNRTTDIEAIHRVIQEATSFIYISVPEYLPTLPHKRPRFWPLLDHMLREALVSKSNISVRLLMSCGGETDQLTNNFLWSLKSLCVSLSCSLEARFFAWAEPDGGCVHHSRYVVTDGAVYLGHCDWAEQEFSRSAGVGVVIRQGEEQNSSLVRRVEALFHRDWFSPHSRTLETHHGPSCGGPERL